MCLIIFYLVFVWYSIVKFFICAIHWRNLDLRSKDEYETRDQNISIYFLVFIFYQGHSKVIVKHKVGDIWRLFPSQVRTLARTDEARGLLWLMEEEAVQPGGSEETMLERLFSYYGSAQGENKGEHSSCHCLPKPSTEGSWRLQEQQAPLIILLTSWGSNGIMSCVLQEPVCCCTERSPTSSCWATATGQTGLSTTLRDGWATPSTTLPPRTLPHCCKTPRSTTTQLSHTHATVYYN